eukprot:1977294-Pleurochrysis_carterae.AAC.1
MSALVLLCARCCACAHAARSFLRVCPHLCADETMWARASAHETATRHDQRATAQVGFGSAQAGEWPFWFRMKQFKCHSP